MRGERKSEASEERGFCTVITIAMRHLTDLGPATRVDTYLCTQRVDLLGPGVETLALSVRVTSAASYIFFINISDIACSSGQVNQVIHIQ